jgi:hypothetical protein
VVASDLRKEASDMKKLPQKSPKPALSNEICEHCLKPVDLGGPCWLRISRTKARWRAWHLECRDRHLREQRGEFVAALQLLGQLSLFVDSAGDTISDGEAIAAIRGLILPGQPKRGGERS